MSNSKVIKIDSLSLQNMLDEDSELIPLMTSEDEEEIPECGFCLFMRAGPCGEEFKAWEKCLDNCKKNGRKKFIIS